MTVPRFEDIPATAVAEPTTRVPAFDDIPARPEGPVVDTWDYVLLQGGKISDLVPFTERQAYERIMADVKDREGFEDQLTSTLYMASLLEDMDTDVIWDGNLQYSRQIFGKELPPSQVVQMAVQNEGLIKKFHDAVWEVKPQVDQEMHKKVQSALSEDAEDEKTETLRRRIFGGLVEKTAAQWEQAGRHTAIDFMRVKLANGVVTQQEYDKAVKQYNKYLAENPIKARHWAQRLWLNTVGVSRSFIAGTEAGLGYGVAGAGMAVAAGQLGPQVALPEEGFTVPGAFIAGTKIGAFKYWGEQGRGAILRRADEEGLNEGTANMAAALGGPAYAYLEFAQGLGLIRGAKGASSSVMKTSLNLAMAWAKEVSEEGSQKIVTEGSITIGKIVDDQIELSDLPDESKRIAIESWQEMKSAAGPMAMLGLPVGTVSVAGAALNQRQKNQIKADITEYVANPDVPQNEKMRALRIAASQGWISERDIEAIKPLKTPVEPQTQPEGKTPEIEAEAPAEPVGGKEAWEMTRKEFADYNAIVKRPGRPKLKGLNVEQRQIEREQLLDTGPWEFERVPLGTWAAQNKESGDPAYYHLEEFEVNDPRIELPEGEKPGIVVDKYSEWIRQGKAIPPIELVERIDGVYTVFDGHNRITAARLSGQKTIQAWVYKGSRKEIIRDALRSGKPVPRQVLEEYKGEKWADEALVKPAEQARGKEAWEMTREETLRSRLQNVLEGPEKEARIKEILSQKKALFGPSGSGEHEGIVRRAVQQKKPVPPHVLEEYKGEKWADEALAKQAKPKIQKKEELPELVGKTFDEGGTTWTIQKQAPEGGYIASNPSGRAVTFDREFIQQKFTEKLAKQAKPKKARREEEGTPDYILEIEKDIASGKAMDAKAFTPDVVAKELPGKVPAVTLNTQDAPALMDAYWREFDEREMEINNQTAKNQKAIADAMGKKEFFPLTDKEAADTSLAMMLYIDLKEHPEGHEYAKQFTGHQKTLYEQSQKLDAKVQAVADQIIEQNREAGELAVEMDVIRTARENYIAHLWERHPQRERFFAKFRQQTARAKRRKLPGGIAEGWSKGMKLRIEDVTLASQIAQVQVAQAAVGKKLLQAGKDWGILSHQQEDETWVQVEHPGFTTWRYRGSVGLGEEGAVKKGDWVRAKDRENLGKILSTSGDTALVKFVNKQTGAEAEVTLPIKSLKIVRPRGKAFYISEKGEVMEKVPVYAEPQLGKVLNNVFTPSALYKLPGIATITKYNAVIKSTILYTSLFHHQAFLRSYAFGGKGINPVEGYRKGRQAIENMTPEIRMLVRNGMTLGRIQDYDPRMLDGKETIWGRVFDLTRPTEELNAWLQNMRRKQEKLLFNKLGPFLKAHAGILELRAGLARNKTALQEGTITEDEIAAQVANLMNNDFGGLHLGRMGRNNTVQHLLRLSLLAPDWTESNVRSMVEAFRKGERGHIHRAFWGRIAAKGLGATILFNLLLSAFDDEDFVERYKIAWKENKLRWLEVDITPIYEAMGGRDDTRKYFSLIGHFRDPIKFVTHPGRSIKHKNSVVARVLIDGLTGHDWAGREFTSVQELLGLTEDDLAGKLTKWEWGKASPVEPWQIPSWFAYEVRASMPIPIQNILAFLGGELDGFDAITKSFGLMTSTTYPQKNKKKMTQLYEEREQ